MMLSIIVLRISLTFKRAFNTPAMPPHTEPASAPAIKVDGSSNHAGQVRKVRAKALAASAPTINWPSPPMLMAPPRKEMQTPSATRSSGVALARVEVRPLTLPKAPLIRIQ